MRLEVSLKLLLFKEYTFLTIQPASHQTIFHTYIVIFFAQLLNTKKLLANLRFQSKITENYTKILEFKDYTKQKSFYYWLLRIKKLCLNVRKEWSDFIRGSSIPNSTRNRRGVRLSGGIEEMRWGDKFCWIVIG